MDWTKAEVIWPELEGDYGADDGGCQECGRPSDVAVLPVDGRVQMRRACFRHWPAEAATIEEWIARETSRAQAAMLRVDDLYWLLAAPRAGETLQ